MFQVESSRTGNRSNLFFTDYFPQSTNSFFLLTFNLNDNPFLKSVNAFILQEILKLKPNRIPEERIKDTLQEFFNELNWKINAQFNQSGETYKGVSLCFIMKRDNRLYLVQFGRLACGLMKRSNFEEIGLSWDNYPIATVESLNRIGSIQEDIAVRVHSIVLEFSDSLFVFPSPLIPTVKEVIPAGVNSILTVMANASPEEHNYLFLCNAKAGLIKPIRFFQGHSFRISGLIMGLIIIVTILYYFFGDNVVEEFGKRTEESISGHNFLFEVKNLTDNLGNQELDKQLKKFVYSPAKDITLSPIWQGQFSRAITYPPLFDNNNIYLLVGKNIAALDKNSKEVVWRMSYISSILRAVPIENNLLLLLENRHLILLNGKGEEIWEKISNSNFEASPEPLSLPRQVTRRDDKRLNSGIIVVPEGSNISIISLITGETVSSIKFEDDINYLSDYDPSNNCFYGVVNDNLVIFKLLIKVW
ncbi:MAG: hypothetical protein JXR56_03180 [Candidatus Cloacimonetes bacterium]|nr:hypothetical protein [Candidatus Cloacimonadota bacterium]